MRSCTATKHNQATSQPLYSAANPTVPTQHCPQRKGHAVQLAHQHTKQHWVPEQCACHLVTHIEPEAELEFAMWRTHTVKRSEAGVGHIILEMDAPEHAREPQSNDKSAARKRSMPCTPGVLQLRNSNPSTTSRSSNHLKRVGTLRDLNTRLTTTRHLASSGALNIQNTKSGTRQSMRCLVQAPDGCTVTPTPTPTPLPDVAPDIPLQVGGDSTFPDTSTWSCPKAARSPHITRTMVGDQAVAWTCVSIPYGV